MWVLVIYRYLSGVVFVGMGNYKLLFMDSVGNYFMIDENGALTSITNDRFTYYVNMYAAQIECCSLYLCVLSPVNHGDYIAKGYTEEEIIREPRGDESCRSLLARLDSGEWVLAPRSKQTEPHKVIVYKRKSPVAANPVLDVLSRLCRLI